MAMSRMARGGMMGRLRKRMSPEDREAMGSKYSGEFNRAYQNATQSQSGQDPNQAGGDMMQRVRSQLGGLDQAGQGAVDAGRLRQGDSARAMGQDHPEPDADDMGGPPDNDADDAAPRARSFTRMREARQRMNAGVMSGEELRRLEAATRGRR